MKEKYLYTLDGKQIMHKNGKPVILREHVNQYLVVIRLGWWGGISEV